MIDLLLEKVGDPRGEQDLVRERAIHVAAVRASAGAGNRGQVRAIEDAVRADPARSLVVDAEGAGALSTGAGTFPTGGFEIESPEAHVTPIASYFNDPTQAPRASISAFPGTSLRHDAAPGPAGGRFVQATDGRQLNLLEAVCTPGVARIRSGYLTWSDIADPAALATALEGRFDEIRVGVHDGVPVVLGYDWDGAVAGERRIGQVFTSTFVGGGNSRITPGDPVCRLICTALLRAAYLGTLLAAATLGRAKVVLTMIGGGAFGNPVPLIWESIVWAVDEVERLSTGGMDVVVNGRNLGTPVPLAQVIPPGACPRRSGRRLRRGRGQRQARPLMPTSWRWGHASRAPRSPSAGSRGTRPRPPTGIAAFEQGIEQRSRTYSYEQSGEAELGPDEAAALEGNPTAAAFFGYQPPGRWKKAILRVVSAKEPETRAKRFTSLHHACANGRRL